MDDILNELGTDAAKWCAIMVERGIVQADPTPGNMFHAWLCNAIEFARSAGYWQAMKDVSANDGWQERAEKAEAENARLRNDVGRIIANMEGTARNAVEAAHHAQAEWIRNKCNALRTALENRNV